MRVGFAISAAVVAAATRSSVRFCRSFARGVLKLNDDVTARPHAHTCDIRNHNSSSSSSSSSVRQCGGVIT